MTWRVWLVPGTFTRIGTSNSIFLFLYYSSNSRTQITNSISPNLKIYLWHTCIYVIYLFFDATKNSIIHRNFIVFVFSLLVSFLLENVSVNTPLILNARSLVTVMDFDFARETWTPLVLTDLGKYLKSEIQ